MKKFRFVGMNGDKFILDTGGKNPAICYVWDLDFSDTTSSNIRLQIDWVINSCYSRGRRKKMLRNGIVSFLRKFIKDYKPS